MDFTEQEGYAIGSDPPIDRNRAVLAQYEMRKS